MNPERLLTLTGTLTTVTAGGTVDDYNNPVDVTTTSTVACWVEQKQATEDTVDTNQQAEMFRLYLEAGAGATGHDRLTVGSSTWEIVGPPWEATSPRTRTVTHIEANGRRVA